MILDAISCPVLQKIGNCLTSVLDEDDLSLQQIKEMAGKAISKETGEYIMTLAERLRKEGEERGLIEGEKRGVLKGEKIGEKKGKR